MDELAADGKSRRECAHGRWLPSDARSCFAMAFRWPRDRPAGRISSGPPAAFLGAARRRSKRGMQAYLSRKFPEVLGFVNVLMERAIAAAPDPPSVFLADLFVRPTCRIRDDDGHSPRSHGAGGRKRVRPPTRPTTRILPNAARGVALRKRTTIAFIASADLATFASRSRKRPTFGTLLPIVARMVRDEEGTEISSSSQSLTACKTACDANNLCRSFSYSGAIQHCSLRQASGEPKRFCQHPIG